MAMFRIRMTRSWAWLLLLLAGLLPVHAVADELFESCPVAHAPSHDHDFHDVHEDGSPTSCHQHCSLTPPVSQGRAFLDRHPLLVPSLPVALAFRLPDRRATPIPSQPPVSPAIVCSSAFHTGVGLRLYA